MKKWLEKNTSSLAGKTVAVSGATGGIGNCLCEYLAGLGAGLILLDRNGVRSRELGQRLQAKYVGLAVDYIPLDLADMDSVKSAAEQLKKVPVDVLILNAGAYHIPRLRCSTGLDNVFQINFAAPYYLVRTLLSHLQSRGGRVVAVGSIAHNYSKIDPKDLDFSTYRQSSKAYGNGKRFLMYSLYGLFDGKPGLAVTHPGITLTNITAHYPKWLFAIIRHPMKVIFMKPRKACLSILRGVFEDCGRNEWIGPRLFQIWGLPKKSRLHTCSPDEAQTIFLEAERIYQQMQ